MSIRVAYRDRVFRLLEEVAGTEPVVTYTAFVEDELRTFIETVCWLNAGERSTEFWDNPADAVYDTLWTRPNRSDGPSELTIAPVAAGRFRTERCPKR